MFSLKSTPPVVSGLAVVVLVLSVSPAWSLAPVDSSGGLQIAMNSCLSTTSTAPTKDCGTGGSFMVVGGGANVSVGGFLGEARPITSASNGFLWRATSNGATAHAVRSWAIGLQIPGINARTLRSMLRLNTATNPAPSTPSIVVRAAAGRSLLGGGARVSTGPLKLANSIPTIDDADHTGWFAGTNPAPATISASQMSIPFAILEGAGLLEVRAQTGIRVTVASGEAVATGAITAGWAPIAWGGASSANAGAAARYLTKIAMPGNGVNPRSVEVRSRSASGGGTATANWIEARIRPNSHGLCNVGDPISQGNQDSCARDICASDSFCCTNAWDAICVSRVETICGRSCDDYTCSAPTYTPSFWNDGGTVQNDNNCYNYATNRRTDTHAAPGRSSFGFTPCPDAPDEACFQVSAFTEFLLADGLTRPRANGTCAEGRTKIALAIAPEFDFHFYRQDSNGRWSHKPGNTAPATNRDESNRIITNPETADRGIYTSFGGYFCTCSDAVEGNGHAVIE